MTHDDMAGANHQIDIALEEAYNSGHFMAAVWYVDDLGVLNLKKTTWQFPVGRLEEARDMLTKLIDAEVPKAPVRPPLPLAAFLAQRPVEQYEEFEAVPPPIVNEVLPLDSEDME